MTSSLIFPYVFCVWRSTSTAIAAVGAISSAFMAKALSSVVKCNGNSSQVSFATHITNQPKQQEA